MQVEVQFPFEVIYPYLHYLQLVRLLSEDRLRNSPQLQILIVAFVTVSAISCIETKEDPRFISTMASIDCDLVPITVPSPVLISPGSMYV
jgi:hypothetical protein